MDDVVQGHDVVVPQVLEQTRLPDGGEGGPLFLLKSDLLELYYDSHSSSA